MASLITVRIDKGNSPNLGFRLQGGKDFGTPLVIQKVNGGSPAERAGLIAGDSVIKINNIDVYNLRHKDAQDVVVKSGNSFDISVQRGGSTWKPAVIPTGSIHSPASNFNNVSPVTKTSLAANRSDNIGSIGTGHNVSAKPFSPHVNGAVNGGPKLVNKQYNTPLKLYSEESIAETLSAQTEVLSTGALGVNFKKNERNYDASNSEVLRALKESESDPNYQDQVIRSDFYSTHSHAIGGRKSTTPNPNVSEQTRSVSVGPSAERETPKPAPEGATICTDCERVIVGVFVRIKDKNLHVECFKCSTCGSSLKNVGYYNINNKLYCDIHAKSAALKNQSNPNLVPVTVPPGSKAPANAISSALSSHSYPSPSPLSPKLNISGTPYQAEETKENVDVASSLPNLVQSNVTESNINNNNTLYSSSTPLSFSNYLNKSSNFAGPKPFSSISAPLSPHNTLPKAAPLSPVAPAPAPTFNNSYSPSAYSPSSVQVTENIVWPPPQETTQVPTACPLFYPPPSQIEQSVIQKRRDKQKVVEKEEEDTENCPEIEHINAMARFISGGSYRRRSTEEVKETLAETLDTQMLVENIVKTRVSPAVPPVDADIPQCIRVRRNSEPKENPKEITINQQSFKESGKFKETSKLSPIPNIDISVPLKWESPLTQAIRTTSPDKDTFASLPIAKHISSSLASALKVAPAEPFKPTVINEEAVPLPEETIPYFPPERPVLSDEPPIRKKKYGPADKLLEDLPEPIGKLTLRDALLTAPERPYSPFVEITPPVQEKENKIPEVHVEPLKPVVLPPLFETHKKDPKPPIYYPPTVLSEEGSKTKSKTISVESQQFEAIKSSTQTSSTRSEQIVINENQNVIQSIGPIFQGFSCSFQNKGDISQFSVDVRTTPPIISPPPIKPLSQTIDTKTETVTNQKQSCQKSEIKKGTREIIKHAEEIIPVKAVPPVTLRKPKQLPQYQVELSAEAESELLMLERKRKAELKTEQQKSNIEQTQQKVSIEQTQQKVCPPVIKVETEKNNTFKPVIEERLPRPGSGMSSRTGMTSPALLPYYQTNLVPQKMIAAHSSVFDPKSPGTSRSPSPYPAGGRDRSPSPLPGTKSNVRAVSPAPGPPENPLKSSTPLPTPETIRIDQARESLTSYLPEYKIRRDQLEESQDIGLNKQMYTSVVQTQNYPIYPIEDSVVTQKSDFLESQRSEKKSLVEGESTVAISREEQMKQAHLEAKKQSHSQSVETSADGLTRVQRKRVVKEEYERSQKEVNVQIEKNVTSTKKYPFSDAKPPSLELSNTRGHVTDPQRMSSSFLKTGCAQIEHCLKQRNPNLPAASSNQHDLAPSSAASSKHVSFPSSSNKPNVSSVSQPDLGTTSGRQTGGVRVAPRRGRGILNPAAIGGARIPLCGSCNMQVRGPFITALGKIWCPNHFICSTQSCRRPLQDIGFVEERGQLYCEYCFEQYLAPPCSKCGSKIKGDCLKAIGKNFHPECFNCTYCGKLFGNNPFFLEDGSPYCEADWNELFTTKCYACAFPIEAGDRWVEALNNNYHSQCFNCTMCKKNLEGQSFFAKGGRPFCKNHAR